MQTNLQYVSFDKVFVEKLLFSDGFQLQDKQQIWRHFTIYNSLSSHRAVLSLSGKIFLIFLTLW